MLVAIINTRQGPTTRAFVVGSDNTVYSIASESGKVAWQRKFPNTLLLLQKSRKESLRLR